MTPSRIVSVNVKPYWARIAVIPSPVDQVQLPSGLIAPLTLSPGLERGVVEATHDSHADNQLLGLPPGSIVYYFKTDSVQIGDVDIVQLNDVIAYEEPDS